MASDFPKQKILIRDLATKSVILYPSRAHITRDINDVILKPGINEVEILGLTPSIDENSVQIDGKGAATIIDMTVELVPNSDIFNEIYPEDDDELDTESDVPYADSDDDTETVKSLSAEIKTIKDKLAAAIQRQSSANQRLAALEQYAKSIKAEKVDPSSAKQILDKYAEESAALFEQHSQSSHDADVCRKQLARKENEQLNAGKEMRRQKELEERKKEKERKRRALQKAEKRKAAQHLKQERLNYWPKKVYKIVLLLETASVDTPSSSRRNSLDSVTLAQSPITEDVKALSSTGSDTLVSLSLSYVTKDATWTPRYDLKISSVNKSALIVYRTEFINNTSETWRDAKISFSTSQTSYQGLDDVVPFMHPWHIRTGRNYDKEAGLLSSAELNKSRYKSSKPAQNAKSRSSLYAGDSGPLDGPIEGQSLFARQHHRQTQQVQRNELAKGVGGGGLFGSSHVPQAPGAYTGYASQTNAIQSSFGAVPFGAAAHPPPAPQAQPLARSRKAMAKRGGYPDSSAEVEDAYDPTVEESGVGAVEVGADDSDGALEFSESSWEDSGLTATYDIPGTRTLPPSSQTRRHKIATLTARAIAMSHVSVPKLRAAAFLRVKIRNPSASITLIKGSAGVTLDGSFIGNMTLPRVAPSQLFDLPLGVDPSIHVSYPKPTVRRSTQGILFGKEAAHVFSRSVWLNNTKAGPVDLLVLDQVPVSQEEKLRVDVLVPKGLGREGDAVRTGVSAKEAVAGGAQAGAGGKGAGEGGKNWGSAVATLKKNGEVAFTVRLEKGQGCLLRLDYEARLPSSEQIIQA